MPSSGLVSEIQNDSEKKIEENIEDADIKIPDTSKFFDNKQFNELITKYRSKNFRSIEKLCN